MYPLVQSRLLSTTGALTFKNRSTSANTALRTGHELTFGGFSSTLIQKMREIRVADDLGFRVPLNVKRPADLGGALRACRD